MTTMHEVEFAYDIGEEVVFRLDGVAGADGWSIGEIVERIISGGRPRYTVRYQEGDERRMVTVAEDAVEGTA
jgi:hypothetical protein